MELRLTIPDDYMNDLQTKLSANKASDVTRDALTLLNWAVGEVTKGRVILSATPSDTGKATDIHRLAMPSLDQVSGPK